MYAMIQCGCAVFGLGATAEAAIEDAREALPDLRADEVSARYDAVDGRMYVVPCTDRLAAAVERDGKTAFVVYGRGIDAVADLPDDD